MKRKRGKVQREERALKMKGPNRKESCLKMVEIVKRKRHRSEQRRTKLKNKRQRKGKRKKRKRMKTNSGRNTCWKLGKHGQHPDGPLLTLKLKRRW